MTIFIGIDPGLTGAIAFLYPDYVVVDDIPVVAAPAGGTIKKEVDVLGLRMLLRQRVKPDDAARVTIEHTAPFSKSAMSAASLEATKASIVAVMLLAGLEVQRVRPHEWQRLYGIKNGAVGCSGIDTGEQARQHAIRLLGAQYFGRKKDHNRADAALIANWARRMHA